MPLRVALSSLSCPMAAAVRFSGVLFGERSSSETFDPVSHVDEADL